jgi:glycine cleavage system H protein
MQRMSAPRDRRYTKTHEWARIEGDIVTVGLTDYAQQELGDITYLELPEVGDSVTASESFGVVESVKAASDVYAPVDGEVVERNDGLIDTPEVINQSPYEGAWLIKVKLGDPAQAENLMDPDTYDTFAAAESH